MKTYTGRWTPGSTWEVFVDGLPLDPRFDLRNHSPSGVCWGYRGSGPAQCALAILADALGKGKTGLTLALYQDFKKEFVAGWPQEGDWTLSEEVVLDWVQQRWEQGQR